MPDEGKSSFQHHLKVKNKIAKIISFIISKCVCEIKCMHHHIIHPVCPYVSSHVHSGFILFHVMALRLKIFRFFCCPGFVSRCLCALGRAFVVASIGVGIGPAHLLS